MSMEPAKYISSVIREVSICGPTVGRLRTMATMALPDTSDGKMPPMVEMKGLRAIRTGYLSSSFGERQPLGPGRRHVGLAEFIEQVAPHNADHPRGAADPDDEDRQPDMLHQVDEFRPTPRLARVLERKQTRGGHPEPGIDQIHQHQGDKKRRHAHADETEQGKDVVGDRVLPGRRVDADRQCQRSGDENAEQAD